MRRLCKVSGFFKGALHGGFREAQTSSLHLLEEDVRTFEIFIRWLYGYEIFNVPPLTISSVGRTALFHYIKLYVFASKMLIPKLQNDIVRELHVYFEETSPETVPIITTVLFLYENTAEDAKLRFLLASCLARYLKRPLCTTATLTDQWNDALSRSAKLGQDIIAAMISWGHRNRESDARVSIGTLEDFLVDSS